MIENPPKKKQITEALQATELVKMSTKRTDVIIRTQINILSVFDNIYIFLSRVNQEGGAGLPYACACVRERYRWPRLTTRSNGTKKISNR